MFHSAPDHQIFLITYKSNSVFNGVLQIRKSESHQDVCGGGRSSNIFSIFGVPKRGARLSRMYDVRTQFGQENSIVTVSNYADKSFLYALSGLSCLN